MSEEIARIIDTYPQRGHSKIPGGPAMGRENHLATERLWTVFRWVRDDAGKLVREAVAAFETEQEADKEHMRLMGLVNGSNQETPAARRVREFLDRQRAGSAEQPGDIPEQAAERQRGSVLGGKVDGHDGPGARLPDGRLKGANLPKRRGRAKGSE